MKVNPKYVGTTIMNMAAVQIIHRVKLHISKQISERLLCSVKIKGRVLFMRDIWNERTNGIIPQYHSPVHKTIRS